MRRTPLVLGIAALTLLVTRHESQAQRGGRGGVIGGARVGSVSYAGVGVSRGASRSVIGPAGSTRTASAGGGSYTTQRGTTINYGGAGRGGTTAGGVNYGRGVGGVQVTTPGGRTATKVGTAGGIAGPGGGAIGGRAGVTAGSGPRGAYSGAYRGGVAVGPHGAVAGGARVGAATGIGGTTISGAARRGAAVGPYGAVAGGARVGYRAGPGGVAVGGARAVAGRTGYGTYYAGRGAIVATGGTVRTNFGYYNTFNRGWYAQYPGAWYAAGWTAARIWAAPAWGTVASYCSYPAEAVYYDYGETVVYSGDTVTVNQAEIPAEQYAQQATDIAATGTPTKDDPKPDDFELLGVFAMVQEGEEKSTNIFQLAVSKGGLIRGNYYNALTDTTEPVYGSVDKETQRAAWTVADRKYPVYEAGIANLTKDETAVLVHFRKDDRQQYILVRIRQPEGDEPTGMSQ